MKRFALLLVCMFGAGLSFGQETVAIGNFGGNGTNAPKLELKENHTFVYTDFTNKKKPIEMSGPWIVKDGKLVLASKTACYEMTRFSLKIKENGNCLTIRKGLAFYRLCICE